MVDRKPKLIAAGAVLAAGLGVAMLFRRTEPPAQPPLPTEVALAATGAPGMPIEAFAPGSPAAITPTTTPTPLDGQFSPLDPLPATTAGLTTGVGLPVLEAPRESAPSATVPTDAVASPLPALSPANASGGRPVYEMLGPSDAPLDEAASPYEIHIIQRNDSLERLAERYLGDSGRSLELFDLNRDVLDNPHILKLGTELKIPIDAGSERD